MKWRRARVSLAMVSTDPTDGSRVKKAPVNPYQVVIEGIWGDARVGSIAIDDISFVDGECIRKLIRELFSLPLASLLLPCLLEYLFYKLSFFICFLVHFLLFLPLSFSFFLPLSLPLLRSSLDAILYWVLFLLVKFSASLFFPHLSNRLLSSSLAGKNRCLINGFDKMKERERGRGRGMDIFFATSQAEQMSPHH